MSDVTRLDPRPDLAEDHASWVAVLAAALEFDPHPGTEASVHGLLHGLRCAGARLMETERDGRAFYRVDYRPVVADGWSEDELRAAWLGPAREPIIEVFGAAAARRAIDVAAAAQAEIDQRMLDARAGRYRYPAGSAQGTAPSQPQRQSSRRQEHPDARPAPPAPPAGDSHQLGLFGKAG